MSKRGRMTISQHTGTGPPSIKHKRPNTILMYQTHSNVFLFLFSFQQFTQPAVIEQMAYVLIVCGALMFFLSFMGYCGAIRESPCMLTTVGYLYLSTFHKFSSDHRSRPDERALRNLIDMTNIAEKCQHDHSKWINNRLRRSKGKSRDFTRISITPVFSAPLLTVECVVCEWKSTCRH